MARRRKRDPHRHIDRLVNEAGGAGAERRAREREEAARAAAAPTTAARWLVPDGDGAAAPGAPVDVVHDLLALPPGTGLQGREGDRLRTLAGHVEWLVAAGATCPSGAPLLDVLVEDAAAREELAPSLDVAALLAGEPAPSQVLDRTIRLARAMAGRAEAHRSGAADLAAVVAPPLPRHPRADEVDALVAVAGDGVPHPPNPAVAVSEVEGGWLGASPLELFTAVSRGLVVGAAADLVGEALARWLDGWVRGPDPWRQAVLDRHPVDADGLLRDAASRAGSDHPAVLGSVLVELVAARHPLG